MDVSPSSFIGRPATDLPTPSLILSKPVLERNIQLLLQDVQQLGITFRPHVKTLKVRILWTSAAYADETSQPRSPG
jgi:D-serine deaminase-like pyridoxal phosphate-dependent protein